MVIIETLQVHSITLENIIDIDECIEDTDACAQNCTNSIGSYTCSCVSGYRLANNRLGCNGQYIYESAI